MSLNRIFRAGTEQSDGEHRRQGTMEHVVGEAARYTLQKSTRNNRLAEVITGTKAMLHEHAKIPGKNTLETITREC